MIDQSACRSSSFCASVKFWLSRYAWYLSTSTASMFREGNSSLPSWSSRPVVLNSSFIFVSQVGDGYLSIPIFILPELLETPQILRFLEGYVIVVSSVFRRAVFRVIFP